jgi:hypothetical protein
VVSRSEGRVAALGVEAGTVSAGPKSAPRGRQRRAREPRPRRVFQQVTLTEAEQRALRERAGELGVSVPRLLVESALSTQGETATERRAAIAELFEVRRLVATVANNVNQLAKAANISGQVAERDQLQATLGEVDELLGRLRDLTAAQRNRPVILCVPARGAAATRRRQGTIRDEPATS